MYIFLFILSALSGICAIGSFVYFILLLKKNKSGKWAILVTVICLAVSLCALGIGRSMKFNADCQRDLEQRFGSQELTESEINELAKEILR